MRVSGIRWVVGLVALCVYAWLAFAQPLLVRAAEPSCVDPKTKEKVPCTPTAVPAGGGNSQPSTETNGRICVAAFNDLNLSGIQDAGEAFLSGGQVQITSQATGTITLADLLAAGPNCQFLPGGADYASAETLPADFSMVGANTFNAHLDAGGTVQILFANTNSAPTASPTIKAGVQTATKVATLASTHTATPTATTPSSTATATATATNTPSPSPLPASATPLAPAVGIAGNNAPGVRPTQPPPPVPTNDPQPVGACSPWLIGAGLGLLTTGVSLAGLARQVRRGKAAPPSVPNTDNPPPDPDDGFDFTPSQFQQRTLNTAFTSKGPQRSNDRLSNAGPTPGGIDGSAYQLSLAGLPNRANRFPTGLGVALLVALAVGGIILAGISAAGLAGGVACGQATAGSVIGALTAVAALATGVATSLAVPYTLFLPEGTPTRASVHLKFKKPGDAPMTKKDSSASPPASTRSHTDKIEAANNSTRDSDKSGNQTPQSSGQDNSSNDSDPSGRH